MVWQALKQGKAKSVYDEKLNELTRKSLDNEEQRLLAKMAARLLKSSVSEAHWMVFDHDIDDADRPFLAGLQSKGLVYYVPSKHAWQVMLCLSQFASVAFLTKISIWKGQA